MARTSKSPQEQEAIVADYLLGTATYRQLGVKYDVDYRIIHSWVMKFQGKEKKQENSSSKSVEDKVETISPEVVALREELRLEKLRTELLNAIIDIAEKDLKVSIRKKFGTRQ
jgi:transposase-like protein